MTQGEYVATTHRVVVPEGEDGSQDRMSCPCFIHPLPGTYLSDAWPRSEGTAFCPVGFLPPAFRFCLPHSIGTHISLVLTQADCVSLFQICFLQATCISALSNWVWQHRISLKRRQCAAERGIAWAGAVWTGTLRDALEGPLLVVRLKKSGSQQGTQSEDGVAFCATTV